MKHHDHVMFRSHGREVSVRVSYGSLPVRLPDHSGTELRLVEKLGVLADHVKRISKRMFEVPDFFFYAIADGVSELFTRHGRWHGLDGPDRDTEPAGRSLQLELGF